MFCVIRKATCGLKESGKLVNEQLKKVLAAADHQPYKHYLGLCCNSSCPISFSIVVNDFGEKIIARDDVEHINNVLKNSLPIKSDWAGECYLGMTG